MSHQVITREAAQSGGLKTYLLTTPCKHGHHAPRYVVNKRCLECMSIAKKKAYLAKKAQGLDPKPPLPLPKHEPAPAKRVTRSTRVIAEPHLDSPKTPDIETEPAAVEPKDNIMFTAEEIVASLPPYKKIEPRPVAGRTRESFKFDLEGRERSSKEHDLIWHMHIAYSLPNAWEWERLKGAYRELIQADHNGSQTGSQRPFIDS